MNKLIKKLYNENAEINVEDLLVLLKIEDSIVVSHLRFLAEKYDWKKVDETDNEVPFGSWVDVICLFFECGYESLYDLATSNSRMVGIVLGVLEELKNQEALNIVNSIVRFYLTTDKNLDVIKRGVSSINLMLSFDDKIVITPKTNIEVKEIIYNFIEIIDQNVKETESQENYISIAYCALRRVGDQETIEIIKKRPKLEASYYKGLESIVIKAIKKQMGSS